MHFFFLNLIQPELTIGNGGTPDDAPTDMPEVQSENVQVLDLLLDSWYITVPLMVMSFIAIFIFFERSTAIRKAAKEDEDFMAKLKDHLSAGNLDSARNLCEKSGTPIARMLHKGIARIGKPLKDISTSIENVGKLEIYILEKGLSTLATIAGAAPMLGFLGTVIGMMNVFSTMRGKGSVSVEAISGGTYEAMITTIVGLIVGIIAYMAYNHLVSRVSKVIHKMEARSIEFIDILEEPARS